MTVRFIVVATFAVGLLVGGLTVGTIATSAMHAGRAKAANECREVTSVMSKNMARVECPLGSTTDVAWYDAESKTYLVTCRCVAGHASPHNVPQDDDGTPEPTQPRHLQLEL